jgi:hypothetical protein
MTVRAVRAYRFLDHIDAGTNCRAWLLTILRSISRTWHSHIGPEQVISALTPTAN